jgi:hypothetical protein
MAGATITLDEALDLTRTGDIWLFRGRKPADRAIQFTTNSPVNHVGMSVAIDDLPPLMWHAELGRSLPDLWSGRYHRGVQLHDLRSAVIVWCRRYGQRVWLRQLDGHVTREMEDALLRTIARLDGTPFPSTMRLAARWMRGKLPSRIRVPFRLPIGRRSRSTGQSTGQSMATSVASANVAAQGARLDGDQSRRLETAYCAEVIALTYEAMGLLPSNRNASWYDPGRFWSGDDLELLRGFALGGEIAVEV